MGLEIEKKYLPDKEFADLIKRKYKPVQIQQAYLCREPVIRVRKEDEEYYMTYKGKGLLTREEYNLPLTRQAYEELLPKHSGTVISKKRYKVPFSELFYEQDKVKGPDGRLMIELDVFEADHEGLVILEIEFDSEESAKGFLTPLEFGMEVTGSKEYSNSYLSMEKSKR